MNYAFSEQLKVIRKHAAARDFQVRLAQIGLQAISKCSGFYSRMSTALCPFSFQRNDIVVRQENECVCRVRVGICVHTFTCVIRYFYVNISLFPFLLCSLLL